MLRNGRASDLQKLPSPMPSLTPEFGLGCAVACWSELVLAAPPRLSSSPDRSIGGSEAVASGCSVDTGGARVTHEEGVVAEGSNGVFEALADRDARPSSWAGRVEEGTSCEGNS